MAGSFRPRNIILSIALHNSLLEARVYLTVFVLSTFHNIYNELWNVVKTASVKFYLRLGNSEPHKKEITLELSLLLNIC